MEAHFTRFVFTTLVCLASGSAIAAGYKTANFVVSAPTAALAKEIGDQAELCRRDLALEWIGKELPPWSQPCPIHAQVAPRLGAGGATSFVFDRGEVFNWKMNIQGSRERILDSVLPHEVTHTIFASHFRKPLPRWADEGACTTVEHRSEIDKQERSLIQFLRTGRGIPFKQMFAMTEYPQDVMPLYAQGHSTAQWLIAARGRAEFLNFLADGMHDDNWQRAVHDHYGFNDLLAMQNAWNNWVREGRPAIATGIAPAGQVAANSLVGGSSQPGILRTQSPDDVTPIGNSVADAGPTGPVTVAASNSVYAVTAAKAERERQNPVRTAEVGVNSGASVYDASRNLGAIRR